jgi:hypothetical protein
LWLRRLTGDAHALSGVKPRSRQQASFDRMKIRWFHHVTAI